MAEPTGSIIRMPKVENALGQSTTNAASQKAVTDGIATANTAAGAAQTAATGAQTTANTANTTAVAAKTAAATADGKAVAAKTAAATADGKAVAAQTAANNANNNANNRVPTSRKINGMDLTTDRSITADQVGAYSKTESDARYQVKGQASGVTLGATATVQLTIGADEDKAFGAVAFLFNYGSVAKGAGAWSNQRLPENVVVTNFRASKTPSWPAIITVYIDYRKITGGI